MRLVKEVNITAIFLSLYTPVSLALWYFTGRTTNLVIVMLIGLSIITAYLYIQIARHKLRWRYRKFFGKKRTYITIDDETEEEFEPEPDEDDFDIDDLVGFRTLFSQDKPGGETI